MRVRSAVRPVLAELVASATDASTVGIRGEDHQPLVLVALSGGADSLALAAAVAAEAAGAGVCAGAVVVDHGLQKGSAEVASRAAAQARGLGLDPVVVRRVLVGDSDGPEAAAAIRVLVEKVDLHLAQVRSLADAFTASENRSTPGATFTSASSWKMLWRA